MAQQAKITEPKEAQNAWASPMSSQGTDRSATRESRTGLTNEVTFDDHPGRAARSRAPGDHRWGEERTKWS